MANKNLENNGSGSAVHTHPHVRVHRDADSSGLLNRILELEKENAVLRASMLSATVPADATAAPLPLDKSQWLMLRAQHDTLLDGILTIDNHGIVTSINNRFEEIWNVKQSDFVGQPATKMAAGASELIFDPDQFRNAIKSEIDDPKAITRREVHLHDGRILDRFSTPIVFPDGTCVGRMVCLRDITDSKHLYEKLRRSAVQTELIMRSISSILVGLDSDNKVILWNDPATIAFGIESTDALGHLLHELPFTWNWELVNVAFDEVEANRCSYRLPDISYRRTDGRDGILGVQLNPLQSEDGERLGLLLLASDITERKQIEQHIAQGQKLESIGQLAAGIAHEINTPIQYVGDNLRFLADSFNDFDVLLQSVDELILDEKLSAETLREHLKASLTICDAEYLRSEVPNAIAQSLDGIERVTGIVRAMKDFSHPGGAGKTIIDLNRSIESTITVARNEWKYVADVVLELEPSLPPIECMPGELNQVILNMTVNAAHAIADVVAHTPDTKGTITISTRSIGDSVEMRIADTGTGMPAEVVSKIFDPFFTTKGVGRGTGQGLAISRSVIVDKHRGTIKVESTPGVGTTFIITLPRESPGL